MKRKFIAELLLSMAVMFAARCAEAETKVTFVNKTDRKIYIAMYTNLARPQTKGWYSVEAGKTWVFNSAGALGGDDLGFYAEGKAKDKKTVYWRGNSLMGWVHPTKAFNLDGDGDTFSEWESETMPGVVQVGFRPVKVTRQEDRDGNADTWATITLSIN